jgi:signal transduction histidine kinase
MNSSTDRRNSVWLAVSTVAYIATVFAVDILTPPLIDVWVLYLPLILLLTWLSAPGNIVVAAIACTVLMTIDIFFTQWELGIVFILVILGTRLVALWLVALSGIIIVRGINRRKELEREVLETGSNEQRRIGQELHDNVGQELTGLGLMINALANRSSGNAELSQITARLTTGIIRVQQHIRTLSHGLIPVPVEGKGLCTALEDLALNMAEKSGISVQFSSPGAPVISDHATATHLYRIAQEAVNNALRHANPNSISLCLRDNGDSMTLSIEDDGVGIQHSENESQGMGLRIMQYRAEQIGGVLSLRRRKTGGTSVTCIFTPNRLKDSPDEQSEISAIKGENLDR